MAFACFDNSAPTAPTIKEVSSSLSQAYDVGSASVDGIPGRFIVTLRNGVTPSVVARDHGIKADFVYTHALTTISDFIDSN